MVKTALLIQQSNVGLRLLHSAAYCSLHSRQRSCSSHFMGQLQLNYSAKLMICILIRIDFCLLSHKLISVTQIEGDLFTWLSSPSTIVHFISR